MVYVGSTRRRLLSRILGGILALGLWALPPLSLRGQQEIAQDEDFHKQSLVVAGDAKPIHVYAEQVTTWLEGDQRVFMLAGGVRVEQGLNNLRLRQAAIWVDEAGKAKTGVYRLDLYGEGNITLEEGPQRHDAQRVFLEWATRGEVRIKAYSNPVSQQPMPTHPFFQRGAEERRRIRDAKPGFGLKALQKTTGTAAIPAFPDNLGASKLPVTAPPGELQATSGQEPTPGPLPQAWEPSSPPLPPTNKVTAFQPPPVPAPDPTDPGAPAVGPIPGTPGETPQPQPGFQPAAPPLDATPGAPSLPRTLTIRPRSSQELQARNYPMPDGFNAVVISSPVIISVSNPEDRRGLLDIEADRMVAWTKGDSAQLMQNMQGPKGETTRALEFYLSGNVEIRNQSPKETQIIRADEVYYDVGRSVALAIRGDLEVKDAKLLYPLHFKAEQLQQLGPKLFKGVRTEVFASALPSDPGLKIQVVEATMEEREVTRRTIFGLPFIDRETGQPMVHKQRLFRGKHMFLRYEGVPFFYFPFIQGDAEDPLGPLQSLGFNYNNIFGFQIFTSFNMYDLIGITPVPGTRWNLYADYMTLRGPALGTDFDFAGGDPFGIQGGGRYQGLLKLYGIYDTGRDVLGGGRENAFFGPTDSVPIEHPDFRGRVLAKVNTDDLPHGFTFQGQLAVLSDRNFLEQFFNQEFNNELNQETFLYLKQQYNHWAWTALVEPRLRNWVTETEWYPKLDGHLIGLKLFDLLTYNAHGSIGYARLRPTNEIPFAYLPTDVRTDTARFDWYHEISLPFQAGPFKIAPYLVGDAAYYSQDVTGDDNARLYGGGGLRASVPLSRLYHNAQSDMFNLNGLYHKIVVSGNYFIADSSDALRSFPQLDRLNDDASDQALRDIRPRQPVLNPANAAFLTSSALFDPQLFAVRRLLDNRMDTLDTIDVLRTNVRQRWQTKRGFPGNQHVVDWMTLDVGFSVFPHSGRDNFGETLGIIDYDWVWNIGDRTALVSDGWFEPVEGGPRVFNFGALLNRPDRTNVYLGYRQIDPLQSRAVVGQITFPFNAKYALTAGTTYDFGVNNQMNSVTITRIGTDVQISLGFNYNSILKTFGVTFNIVPNILPAVFGAQDAGSLLAQQGRR